jgi:hypothetical protein
MFGRRTYVRSTKSPTDAGRARDRLAPRVLVELLDNRAEEPPTTVDRPDLAQAGTAYGRSTRSPAGAKVLTGIIQFD